MSIARDEALVEESYKRVKAELEALEPEALATTLQRLAPRWFVMRNAHASSQPILMQPRHARGDRAGEGGGALNGGDSCRG